MKEKESESKQCKILCVGLEVVVLCPQDEHCKNSQVFLDSEAYNFFFFYF